MTGQVLANSGARVLAYEDCPYAIHTPAGLEHRLADLDGMLGSPEVVTVGGTFQRRLDAIAAYTTQVPVVFRFTDDFRTSVHTFACRLAPEHGPVERFWPILPTSDAARPQED
jgi:hypothetical protein